MYNDSMKVENKIISSEALYEIFSKMNEDLKKYLKTYKSEEAKNQVYERQYQNWTFKDQGSYLKFYVDFYDSTSITFDKFENFIMVFETRLEEIKNIRVNYYLYYSVGNSFDTIMQKISMEIYEKKMDITISLNSDDDKMKELYELIKSKILTAPPKYDEVIQKKSSIVNKVGFALGLIPSTVIASVLLFFPEIRNVFAGLYVAYPFICVALGYMIGMSVCTGGITSLYDTILPEKKYAGHDANYKSIYKDDIDSFIKTSEIMIGKNVGNTEKRKTIMAMSDKYNNYLLVEFFVIVIMSLIVILLGNTGGFY